MAENQVKSGLNTLAAKIHETARDHGFWDKERNFGEMIALMHSELSEALEAHREGNPPRYYKITHSPAVHVPYPAGSEVYYVRKDGQASWDVEGQRIVDWDALHRAGVVNRKPEGVAVELADCLIRILDAMQSLGVDIDEIVQEKMEYNDGRAHKHGKAY